MTKVKNKKAINLLAKRSFSHKRGRNIVGILAIVLTSILFSSIFTLAGGLIQQSKNTDMIHSGSYAHGSLKMLSSPEYEAVKNTKQYKNISYSVIVGTSTQDSLKKFNADVRFAQDEFAKESYASPTVGNMPKKEDEIAMSTLVLDALGVPHEIGTTINMDFEINEKK